MVTKRLLNVLRSAGIGVGSFDVTEWADMLALSSAAGVLRLGEYNAKLIDSVLQAWDSRNFVFYPVHEYTYGAYPVSWLTSESFRVRARAAHTFIRVPLGHPIKAEYADGRVVRVMALTVPGEYEMDVTESLAAVFPAGIDSRIKAIYAVVTSSESDWSREAWRTGLLLTGERSFVNGMDKLTLVCIDGSDIQRFCDDGILGALSVPVIENCVNVDNVDKIVDNVENSRCVLVAIGAGVCCALYCSRVQTGEILSVRVSPGAGSEDVVYLDLDSSDTVVVTDLLALRGKGEGSEVYYVSDDKGNYVLSDEYGNFLLGASFSLF